MRFESFRQVFQHGGAAPPERLHHAVKPRHVFTTRRTVRAEAQSIPVPVSNDAWHKLIPNRVLCLEFFMQAEPLLGIVLQPQQHSTEGQLSQVDPATAPTWLGQGLPV